jgi:hemolysin III
MTNQSYNQYQSTEEKLNVWSHGLGVLLSIAALVLMVVKASSMGIPAVLSTLTFGAGLIFLYTSSTLYHSAQNPRYRNPLNVMDHMAIYVLIACTYTPFTVLALKGIMAWIIFGVVWGAALLGIIQKIFFFGKFRILSAIAYVVMGWIIVIAFGNLLDNLGLAGTMWLLAGGISYTIGSVFYLVEKLPYNHAIFHLWVLGGSVCHFVAVYFYVLN